MTLVGENMDEYTRLKEQKDKLTKISEHEHQAEQSFADFYLVKVWTGNRSWNEKDSVDTRGLSVKVCKLCGVIFLPKL